MSTLHLMIGIPGSGKSTLLKLIMRYYDIENDKLFIDDIDINNYSLKPPKYYFILQNNINTMLLKLSINIIKTLLFFFTKLNVYDKLHKY